MSSDETSSGVTYTSISKDGPTDYPADGGDDVDDSSGDDADDEDDEEASKEDEKEHLAPADSITAASLVVDPVPSADETEPFETNESAATPPPPPAYRTTARMSIRAQTPIPFPSEAEVNRILAIPTPPSSPLASLSSPLPRIPSPPFLVPPPPTTIPTYTKAPLGYRAVRILLRTASPPPLPLSLPLPLPPPIILPCTRASMVLMRAAAPSTYILTPRSRTPPSGTPPILPIPLLTSSLPLPLPSTDRRANVPKVVLPPQKRLCITPGPRFEVRRCSFAAAARSTGGFRADYGFVGTLDAEIRRDTDRERVTNFVTTVRHDTDEIYGRLDYAPSERSLMTSQLNVLRRDRARSEFMTLRTTVSALHAKNRELRAADRRRQTQLLETLTQKMPPRKAPRITTTPSTATATTPMTDAAIRALIS
ncbi:hypothetical protein Tco_1164552 [Tanacetum coccineum]